MKFIGISVAKGINTGRILGNAYDINNNAYRFSTLVYDGYGEKLNHDITVIEDDIKVYEKSNGSYVYEIIK